MLLSWVAAVWVLAGSAGDSAADVVRLSDGSTLLGQVAGPGPMGGLVVLVRRDWAAAHVPARLRAWERSEAILVRRARRERKERLEVWRDDRGGDDAISAWIGQEVGRLSVIRPPRTVLTAMPVNRTEVRSAERQDDATARLLRLGWLAGIGGVETMSAAELRDALAFRGRLRPGDPAFVDPLLPLYPEPESRWRTRRAATEVALEPGARFVRFRQFVLPETGPGSDANPATRTELIDSPAGREGFASIQAVTPFDEVGERLAAVANRGRIGAVFTRLEFAAGSDRADAETTFWVRQEDGRWSATLRRTGTARTDEPAEAQDPDVFPEGAPVRTAVQILELVSSNPKGFEESDRLQFASTAAERALGRARVALDRDLAPLLMPVTAPAPGPGARRPGGYRSGAPR